MMGLLVRIGRWTLVLLRPRSLRRPPPTPSHTCLFRVLNRKKLVDADLGDRDPDR